jgi:hypothetical protein
VRGRGTGIEQELVRIWRGGWAASGRRLGVVPGQAPPDGPIRAAGAGRDPHANVTKELVMSRSLKARAAAATVVAASAAALSLAGAGAAAASQSVTIPLEPGQAACVSQYAGYQVRADGSATGQGARFKLLRNGAVVQATYGRVGSWSTELRSSWGYFPGPGYYAACAYNTGSSRTTVFLQISTDGELG